MRTTQILILIVALIMLLGWPAGADASTDIEHICVVLAQDNSGSMKENDPGFLRNTGTKLFIVVLDDGDQVGLVRFSTNAIRITPALVRLTSPQDKYQLMEHVQDVPPEGYTDIRTALQEAIALLQSADCEQRFIVLLSDGQPELRGGVPANYASSTIDLVQRAGIPILGIALTPSGESGLLYRLAAATNPPGRVIPARTASDLLDAYLEAVAQLKDRTVVGGGFTSSPGFSPLPLEPGLAQYVSRVTYIVSKPENVTAQLVAPGSETISPEEARLAFSYTADPRFAAYTIDSPAPGGWGFDLHGRGQVQARAILRSRLRISVHQLASYHPLGVPLPLAASMVEEGLDGALTNLIGEVSFSAVFIRPDGSQDSLDQLFDDGTHGDLLANDGIFTNEYVKTDIPGEYQVTITAYKGLIPVGCSLKFVVVLFPQIVPLSPREPEFEFRGKPLPITMKLEGGDPPTLDAGAFVARVTGPGNLIIDVPLWLASGDIPNMYTAQFTPPVDGSYTIEYLPVNATYKGVPYTQAARKEVNIRLIPAINIAESHIDLGTVEAAELSRGLSLKLSLTSSSKQAEAVGFDIIDLPGLSVAAVSPQEIPPGASQVHLTLRGNIDPGKHQSTLFVTTREGVDLLRREIPLVLTVYQPTLTVKPAALDLSKIREDRIGQGLEVPLNISSSSLKDEPLFLGWKGPEKIRVHSETTSLAAGKATLVQVNIQADSLPVGVYSGHILLSSREGVQVTPAWVEVKLVVVPAPFCSRWCLPIGGGFVVLALVSAAAWIWLTSRDHLTGSLKGLKAPPGQTTPDLILLSRAGNFLNPGQAIIGSGPAAPIQLPGGNVRPKHAAIKTCRAKVMEHIGRPPRNVQVERRVNVVENLGDGLVKVNNVMVLKGQRSVPLRTGVKIQFGEYEFEYRE